MAAYLRDTDGNWVGPRCSLVISIYREEVLSLARLEVEISLEAASPARSTKAPMRQETSTDLHLPQRCADLSCNPIEVAGTGRSPDSRTAAVFTG